ncbi:MAG: hypothetical protein H7Y27_07795 [Gemmatimonadaceae bacterium]|nr:hypothetical protein [Chitinophagaceae bacterium]
MKFIYKTLLKQNILHEYFLTRPDGSSVFELPQQNDRLNFLAAEYSLDKESINADLRFIFPPSEEKSFENAGLKIIPSYSGFRIVIRVYEETLADQTKVFRPAFTLPPDLNITVLAVKIGNSPELYTNGKLRKPFNSAYLFGNNGEAGTKQFPYLSATIPAVDPLRTYDEGELTSDGATVSEFFIDAGVGNWRAIDGTDFAGEKDRNLLPARFTYFLPASPILSQLKIELKDADGNILRTTEAENSELAARKVSLDFTGIVDDAQTYQLVATGDNGFQDFYLLHFNTTLMNEHPWAVFRFKTHPSQTTYRLIDDEGLIIRRQSPDGSWLPEPNFEVPFKSRFVYWRFLNSRSKELNLTAELGNYFTKEGAALVTKLARPLSRDYFFLKKQNPTDELYVPNPTSYELKSDEKGRTVYEIRVPESELFPVVV